MGARLFTSFAALLLLCGCSNLNDKIVGKAGGPTASPSAPTASPSAPTTSGQPSGAPPAPPPAASASLADVLAWIEAADPVDPRRYSVVTQTYRSPQSGAPTTQISADPGFAFSSPSGRIHCVSAQHAGDLTSDVPLSCVADLKDPPPKPNEAPVRWYGDWVFYEGDAVQIGTYQGGCSALSCYGESHGTVLPYGRKISAAHTGPDQPVCRMDQTGLWCADKAKGSAILLNDHGVTPYGCLRPSVAEQGGVRYSC